ncbi:MAG: T9SS type A sorting domain-containing protein [Flavobacteriales bacterium]|nr:T9SS type A sorting domain-containing protein [Flavobacteriales bacterium]
MSGFVLRRTALVPNMGISSSTAYVAGNEPSVGNINLTGFENATRVHVARNVTNNSTYALLANADVRIDGEQIILKEGFTVNTGAKFLAHLGNVNTGCSSQTPFLKTKDPDMTGTSQDGEFRIYPNPTRGETTVQYRVAENTPVRIRLLDYTGRVVKVLVNETVTDESLHVVKVNGDHLAPGIYQVIMQKPDGSRALRMIVAD